MLEQPAEQRIIQMAQRGDQDAISKLYGETKRYAYSIARQYLRSEADIEDALQEAYTSVFGKLDTFREGMSFKPWLHKIVSNKCLNYIRDKRFVFVSTEQITELAADDEEVIPADWLEQAEKRRDIMRMIDALPEGQRMAIFLHYVEELSIAEIAEIMGIAEGSVKSHLFHGRKAIKAGVLLEEKKGNKLYGLVPMPMLAKVFELEAESTVMPEALSKAVWEGVRKNLIENGIIKSASAANSGVSNANASQSAGSGQNTPGAGTNTTCTGTTAPNEGLNTPNAGTPAANASANAAGAEVANKGGLIKMFLGLSTGKKIGVIAASLAVLTCLSLLCSALAASSPSSGLGDFVQVTPTPTPTGNGPNVAPPNPNGPGSGSGGGGTGNPDGPGQGEPENPPQPPPKQGGKQGEQQDNTPIEVEVPEDGRDADIKPKKAKIKKAKYVWSITAQGTAAINAKKNFVGRYTLTLNASKSGDMFGEYKGTARLDNNVDCSEFNSVANTVGSVGRMSQLGPIQNPSFQLAAPSKSNPPAPKPTLDSDLAPLVPEDDAITPLDGEDITMAIAEGSWPWSYHFNWHVDYSGMPPYDDSRDLTDDVKYVIRVYPGGIVSMDLNIDSTPFHGYVHYSGRIAKKVTLVDVN